MNGITVGVFRAVSRAREGIDRLRRLGYTEDLITILAPRSPRSEIERGRATDAEQEGMGPALAGAIAGGLGLGLGIALVVPGVGPITAAGAVAAGLLAAGGGAAPGAALEAPSLAGFLPADELYVYTDALAKGRSVVLVSTDGHANEAWRALEEAGAESIDTAREDWWVGIRDAERLEHSSGNEWAIAEDGESPFRRGYEAATRLLSRGTSEMEVAALVQDEFPGLASERAFLRGYRRGLAAWELRRTCREPSRKQGREDEISARARNPGPAR
jgi:hypothetical protein